MSTKRCIEIVVTTEEGTTKCERLDGGREAGLAEKRTFDVS